MSCNSQSFAKPHEKCQKKQRRRGQRDSWVRTKQKQWKSKSACSIYHHVLLKFNTAFHILSTSHIKSKHKSDQKCKGILHREDKFALLKMKQNIISLMHVIVLHKMVQNLC